MRSRRSSARPRHGWEPPSACTGHCGTNPEPTAGPFDRPQIGGFVTFASLGLPVAVLKGIRAAGLTEPTAIQSKAIPIILQGNDLIGAAQSGSGKTGAYALPLLARLIDSAGRLR